MYRVLSKVMKTEKQFGRQTDDIRSFVRSIFLAIRDSPIKDGEQKRKGTIQSRIWNFGIPRRTAFRYWSNVEESRKLVSEGKMGDVFFSSIVSRNGFYKKVSKEIIKKLHDWIFKHPHVIVCPDKRDTLLIPDPDNIGETKRVAKWLLQIPVTELHQDLLSKGKLGFKQCRKENGDVIIPDTALRELMPKQIRPMTDRYKEMCCCTICITMQNHQSNLNNWRKMYVAFLLNEHNKIPFDMNDARHVAGTKYSKYKDEVLPQGKPLHPKGRHAVSEIQCEPPAQFTEDDLPCYDCAKGLCSECPSYRLIEAEKSVSDDVPRIPFQLYEKRWKCNNYDALGKGEKKCPQCEI